MYYALSFTYDLVIKLISWCCSCWPLVERVTPAQQCISVLYPIKFPGQARDQVYENIPMWKNREILEYLKWVSKIHFPIFDAVVSFFRKNEVIQVKSNRTTIKLSFAWLAWQRGFLLQPLLIDTYWWPTF